MVEKPSTILLSSDSESLDQNNSRSLGMRGKRDEKYQDQPSRKRKRDEPAPRSSQSSESSDDEKHCVWRNTIQSWLGAGANVSDDNLLALIQDRERNLRQVLSNPVPVEQPRCPTPPAVKPFYRILHSVTCSFASMPSKSLDEELPHILKEGHLGSKNRIGNLELYFARNPGLSFVIFKYYSCCGRNDRSSDGENPRVQSESAYILSDDLCSALKQVATSSTERKRLYPGMAIQKHLKNAHLWMFREYEYLKNHSILEDKSQKEHLNVFLSYFGVEKRVEFTELRCLLSKNMINRRYLEYLFVPGEVVISRISSTSQDPVYQQASRIVHWPQITHIWRAPFPNPEQKFVEHIRIEFESLYWSYSSVFHTLQLGNAFEFTAESDELFPISQLQLYPLKYADEKIRQLVEERGRNFWACRRRKYVAYNGWDFNRVELMTNARFMVDFDFYLQQSGSSNAQVADELAAGAMDRDEPPGEDFIHLLPTFVHGYSLEDQKWRKLLVTNTSEIQWDDDSFKTLVMDEDLKEMIMALVTNTLDPERSTDFFKGKGKGLVLLFHGGPGTGKTLTAESVAEFARKPLYRVTCGNIGTQPDQVENYLKSALKIGALWDCVVLMDEAEVFLQERTLNDLNRNALVAVFLRVLEYYSGILILTSNRVGMFDEGFKSRIQLAVHYDKLSQNTRKRVWENFINRLESFKDDQIDIADMRLHLLDLSRYPLNGREIRNVITTARQLAMFRKTPVDFKCLKHCIGISGRFETYLKNLHEGLDGDDLAREEGFRA